ncbi:MAG: hypothetical protein KKD77_21960 [Gammaproteobacteria bacterium]|nr:hypothetical protein [Gammaproteobacteria bacterium]MBU2249428.1 hypothetical protein [Gammaproteobacteria bacterium]MBU2685616.1 hypothetical protein [Gammaproteobacteria bacterium]
MKQELNHYNKYTKGPKEGQPKTLTDRVIRFLIEGLKKTELPSKNQYRKFPGSKPDSFYWVGNAGACRVGKNISGSFSMSSQVHLNMKLWERKEGLK